MGAHNNVHIPKESWPRWTWYTIEFGIVLAVALLVSREISDYMLGSVAWSLGYANLLESWQGINVHSEEFLALGSEVTTPIVSMSNWIFYSMVGAIFGGWYLIIRGFVLKKKVL